MEADIGEKNNLQAEHPEIVANLTMKLKQIITDGRSTPGEKQGNDVPVEMIKKSPPNKGKAKK